MEADIDFIESFIESDAGKEYIRVRLLDILLEAVTSSV